MEYDLSTFCCEINNRFIIRGISKSYTTEVDDEKAFADGANTENKIPATSIIGQTPEMEGRR